MQLPTLQGKLDQSNFFIYAACDHVYFRSFGSAFINSVRANTDYAIHIHLFNPTTDQIDFCHRYRIGVTWEYAPQSLFTIAAQRWSTLPTTEPDQTQYNRTMNAMRKGQDSNIIERIQKTYYACARFIRLAELYTGQTILAVDIDAVVRNPVPKLDTNYDFYLHHITGKRARYLAGGIWLNGGEQCKKFLQQYADQLRGYFEQDHAYWSLDQDLLDTIVPQFNHGQLPMEYIDWNMQDHSYIWTAKGTRKNLQAFKDAQKIYAV
jgi:hypothetical protein